MNTATEGKHVGTVVWFDNKLNYGFIKPNNGEQDIFVHWSDISCEGFKSLKKGQVVVYSIGTNKHGKPKAIEVMVINE